jgi:hypothetical protein
MEPPTPPVHPGQGDNPEASPAWWAEYKRLYERHLEQEARFLERGEESNRLLAESLQLRKQEVKRAERQTRISWWLGLVLGVALLGITAAALGSFIRSLFPH